MFYDKKVKFEMLGVFCSDTVNTEHIGLLGNMKCDILQPKARKIERNYHAYNPRKYT